MMINTVAHRATHWSPPPPEPAEAEPADVGQSKEFWTWDMSVMPPGQKRVTATCRAVGEHAYVYVDDAVWDRLVTEEDVFEVNRRLQEASPPGSVDPGKSVAEINHEYFGAPPLGLDGDPRVYVLMTEFASFKGTTMDGYFNVFDTIPDEEAQEQYGQRSNEAEIVYLNAASRRISGDYMQGVLAHEYQHLLHHPHDGEEEPWLSETLGEVAMLVNGYHTDMGHVARHQQRPERPLVSQTYVDYGACMLFGAYTLERFGKGFIQELTRDGAHGVASIDGTLERLGRPERFDSLYRDWLVANYADSRGVADPGLHYARLDVPRPAETVLGPDEEVSFNLPPTGARYFRLQGSQLTLTGGEGLTAELLVFEGPRMRRVPLGAGTFSLPEGDDRVLVLGSLASGEAEFGVRSA